MLSQTCGSPQWVGRYAWPKVSSRGLGNPGTSSILEAGIAVTSIQVTSSDGHQSMWYASSYAQLAFENSCLGH